MFHLQGKILLLVRPRFWNDGCFKGFFLGCTVVGFASRCCFIESVAEFSDVSIFSDGGTGCCFAGLVSSSLSSKAAISSNKRSTSGSEASSFSIIFSRYVILSILSSGILSRLVGLFTGPVSSSVEVVVASCFKIYVKVSAGLSSSTSVGDNFLSLILGNSLWVVFTFTYRRS